MGKKSKRRQVKQKAVTEDDKPNSVSSSTNTNTENDTNISRGMMHSDDLPTPAGGWALELEEVEYLFKKKKVGAKEAAAARMDKTKLLRLCRAYQMLRQWENLETWTDKLLDQLDTAGSNNNSNSSAVQEEIMCYKLEATKVLSVQSRVTASTTIDWFHKILTEDRPIDKDIWDQPSFSNLNCLQFAALQGDIRLLETVVALGAAIDHRPPVLSDGSNRNTQEGEEAPPDCTALLLACASLALNATVKKLPGMNKMMKSDRTLSKALKGNLECAIQLVRLGADCQLKLTIPESCCGVATSMWRQLGLNHKTAKELALLSGHQELVDTMQAFADQDALIRMAHCRCGSRLPWKDCHLSGLPVESLTMDNDSGRVSFMYSPLAPCYCKSSAHKTHWKCCWGSSRPRYQDDRTGTLHGNNIISAREPGGQQSIAAIANLIINKRANGIEDTEPLFGNFTRDEHRSRTVEYIRTYGLQYFSDSGKALSRDMDPEVYAGVVERLDNFFLWRDDHWALEKSELKLRVQEWNDALEKYCKDKKISGKEQIRVIKLHEASPLAPCANPVCTDSERKIKEFKNCMACRTVAYCSRDCQKAHWKEHKKGCIWR